MYVSKARYVEHTNPLIQLLYKKYPGGTEITAGFRFYTTVFIKVSVQERVLCSIERFVIFPSTVG